MSKLSLLGALVCSCLPVLGQQVAPEWDVNQATLQCYPQTGGYCADLAYGLDWTLTETGSALCNNGNQVYVSTFISASCSYGAYGDTQISYFTYPSQVLTSSGWITRWIGGYDATAYGSGVYGSWLGYDANFCDTYRDTFVPPDVPC